MPVNLVCPINKLGWLKYTGRKLIVRIYKFIFTDAFTSQKML